MPVLLNASDAGQATVNTLTLHQEIFNVLQQVITAVGLNYRTAYVTGTIMTSSTLNSYTAATYNNTSDTITLNSHGFVAGDYVEFTSNGSLPAPLTTGVGYRVYNATTNTFQLATTINNAQLGITLDITGGSSIASVTAGTAGSYTSIPTISFTGGNGSGAAATANMKLVTVSINTAGTGYTPGTFTCNVLNGTYNTRATLSVTVNGSGNVSAVSIVNAGDYSALPGSPVTVDTIANGTGATFTVTWGLSTVTVTNIGSGYTSAPTAVFSSGTATATPVLSTFTVRKISGGEIYWKVWQGYVVDDYKTSLMNLVLKHYTDLGYIIKRETNAATGNTMQWTISW